MIEIGEHQHAGLVMRATVQVMAERELVDPASARVVALTEPQTALVVGLLALTRCRWSEVESISLEHFIEGYDLRITSAKGGVDRTVEGIGPALAQEWIGVRYDLPLVTFPYEHTLRRLRAAMDRAGVRLPAGARNGSHAFRHLYASWRASQGWSQGTISQELGHRHEVSTANYLHDWSSLYQPTINQ